MLVLIFLLAFVDACPLGALNPRFIVIYIVMLLTILYLQAAFLPYSLNYRTARDLLLSFQF